MVSLHRKYFFLSCLISKNEAYRYHRLFRDFLLGQLGNEKFKLLEKAGKIAYRIGELERAVEYFIAAGNSERARETIIESGRKLIRRGDWHTVERWLNNLSQEVIVVCILENGKLFEGGRNAPIAIVNPNPKNALFFKFERKRNNKLGNRYNRLWGYECALNIPYGG